jgi:hypothetical protein
MGAAGRHVPNDVVEASWKRCTCKRVRRPAEQCVPPRPRVPGVLPVRLAGGRASSRRHSRDTSLRATLRSCSNMARRPWPARGDPLMPQLERSALSVSQPRPVDTTSTPAPRPAQHEQGNRCAGCASRPGRSDASRAASHRRGSIPTKTSPGDAIVDRSAGRVSQEIATPLVAVAGLTHLEGAIAQAE